MREVYHLLADNVNDYYANVCKTLMEQGTETSPRGKLTKEIHPTTVLIRDPRRRLLSVHGRVINLPFALVEAIQIITGQNDAQALRFYNSSIVDIQGDGPRGTPHWQEGVMRFNAAYGERLRSFSSLENTDQLVHVIETLRHDPDSRQASIVLSHPYYDNYKRNTRDRACNVYAHAMIRNGMLDWMQVIRSNDAIWGIPYNLVQWSHVQEWVAASLDIQMGPMFIVQDSFHVYEDKYEECRAVEAFDMYQYLEMVPLRMQASPLIADELLLSERYVRNGIEYRTAEFKILEDKVGPYWRAVVATLQAYREFKRGHDDSVIGLLPEYAELRVPMIRNFCHWRWAKDKSKYGDLFRLARLEIISYGISPEETDKWLALG